MKVTDIRREKNGQWVDRKCQCTWNPDFWTVRIMRRSSSLDKIKYPNVLERLFVLRTEEKSSREARGGDYNA